MFNLNQCEDRLLELIEPEEYEDSPVWRTMDGERQTQQLSNHQATAQLEAPTPQECRRGFYSPRLHMFVECSVEEFEQLQNHLNNINKIKSEASADRLLGLKQQQRAQKSSTPRQNPQQGLQRTTKKTVLTVEL